MDGGDLEIRFFEPHDTNYKKSEHKFDNLVPKLGPSLHNEHNYM